MHGGAWFVHAAATVQARAPSGPEWGGAIRSSHLLSHPSRAVSEMLESDSVTGIDDRWKCGGWRVRVSWHSVELRSHFASDAVSGHSHACAVFQWQRRTQAAAERGGAHDEWCLGSRLVSNAISTCCLSKRHHYACANLPAAHSMGSASTSPATPPDLPSAHPAHRRPGGASQGREARGKRRARPSAGRRRRLPLPTTCAPRHVTSGQPSVPCSR